MDTATLGQLTSLALKEFYRRMRLDAKEPARRR